MRTELDVPFSHKEEAKALGAKWDRTKKIWYVPGGVNPEPFAEWLPGVDRSDPSAPYIYLVLGKRECWKCHKETTVAAFGIPYGTDDDRRLRPCARPQRSRAHCHRHGPRQRLAIVPALGCVPGEIRDYLRKRCGYKPVGAHHQSPVARQHVHQLRRAARQPLSVRGALVPVCPHCHQQAPALEFVRVEVAGVYGIPATRTDFDQALFTWARDHHTQFHKQLGEGVYL